MKSIKKVDRGLRQIIVRRWQGEASDLIRKRSTEIVKISGRCVGIGVLTST